MRNHPDARDLALHAGGDLPWARRLAVAWHLRRCGACQRELQGFRDALAALRSGAGLPPGVDWESLAAEMQANIRLGLAAGEAIRRRGQKEGFRAADWRAAAVVTAALAIVAVAGWTLQRRPAPAPSPSSAEVVLRPTEEGLSVKWGGTEAAVFGPGRAPAAAAVSWDGGVRAPFLDEETGQVTIYDVAAQ
ncbi:MAG: hypothetical protein WHT08_07330 [Bryobacteraceae bacterium]